MDDKFYIESITKMFKIYRALISENFIFMPGSGLLDYLEYEHDGKELTLYDVFPEASSYTDKFDLLFSKQMDSFFLNTLSRNLSGGEIFFNLIFTPDPGRRGIFLFIEDNTARFVSEREIEEGRSEIVALNEKISERNIELERKNIELIKLQENIHIINRDLEKKIQERTIELEMTLKKTERIFSQTVKALGTALEKRDPYTAGHQDRVSDISVGIAEILGFDSNRITGLEIASRLHDIGKIYVPPEFLTRPGKLANEEFNVIKMHPKIGFDILKDIEFPWGIAAVVLQHHERLDGSGYPYGLTGEDILLESKILAVADIVETVATDRPYRKAMGLDMALDIINEGRGITLEPDVVDACIALFREGGFTLRSNF